MEKISKNCKIPENFAVILLFFRYGFWSRYSGLW